MDHADDPMPEVLEDGVCVGHPVRELRRVDFTPRHLEMQLPVHVSRPSPARVPDLRLDSADGPVFLVRRDGTPGGAAVRLTPRCKDLLRLLRAARWLTTSQVRRRFFPRATVSAARRRLRLLAKSGYVRKHQENRMREAIFALDRGGKRVLESGGAREIGLERQPPKQMAHLAGINDIRIAAEACDQLAYFFAAWELPGIGWKYPIVPDAVFRLADRTFAVEYDRGVEGLRYFVGAKIARYRRGFDGFLLAAVLVVVDQEARIGALARAIADDRGRFLFSTIDAVRRLGILAPIHRRSSGGAVPLIASCSPGVSRRENSLVAASHMGSTDCGKSGAAS